MGAAPSHTPLPGWSMYAASIKAPRAQHACCCLQAPAATPATVSDRNPLTHQACLCKDVWLKSITKRGELQVGHTHADQQGSAAWAAAGQNQRTTSAHTWHKMGHREGPWKTPEKDWLGVYNTHNR